MNFLQTLVLRLVSLEWHDRAWVIWAGILYDFVKCSAGLAMSLLAVGCLTPKGKSWIERLVRSDPRMERKISRFAGWAFAGVAAVLVFLKIAQYLSLQGTIDYASLLSVAWNVGRGGFLPSPVLGISSHLEAHFCPLIAIYAPLARLTHSPLVLMIAQTLLVLGSVPIFWRYCARLKIPVLMRLLLCAALAANPYFQRCLSTWFYPDVLPIPILLFALYAWEKGSYGAFALAAAALLGTKEEAGFTLGCLGAASLFIPNRRRQGGMLILASTLAFAGVILIMGSYHEGYHYWMWGMFGWGKGPSQVLSFLLLHPWAFVARWVWPPTLFLPLAKLLLFAGGVGLWDLPAMVAVLLANVPHQISLQENFRIYESYYPAFILPFVFWGAARGLERLWTKKKAGHHVLCAALLGAISCGTFTSSDYMVFYNLSGRTLLTGWSYIFKIHPDESVWAPQGLAPALAMRKELRVIYNMGPYRIDKQNPLPDAILVARYNLTPQAWEDGKAYFTKNLGFQIISEDRGVSLWRRAAPLPPR